jgi:hypothetical protein
MNRMNRWIDEFASRNSPTIKKLRRISSAAADWLLNFAHFLRLRKRILAHQEDEELLALRSAEFRRFTAQFVTLALVGSLIASFIASKAAGHLYNALYAWLTSERRATLVAIDKQGPPIAYDELKKIALHLGETDEIRESVRREQEHNALALTIGQFIETLALSASLVIFRYLFSLLYARQGTRFRSRKALSAGMAMLLCSYSLAPAILYFAFRALFRSYEQFNFIIGSSAIVAGSSTPDISGHAVLLAVAGFAVAAALLGLRALAAFVNHASLLLGSTKLRVWWGCFLAGLCLWGVIGISTYSAGKITRMMGL